MLIAVYQTMNAAAYSVSAAEATTVEITTATKKLIGAFGAAPLGHSHLEIKYHLLWTVPLIH